MFVNISLKIKVILCGIVSLTDNNTYTNHIYTFVVKKKENMYKVATSNFLFSTRRRKPFLKRFMHDHK